MIPALTWTVGYDVAFSWWCHPVMILSTPLATVDAPYVVQTVPAISGSAHYVLPQNIWPEHCKSPYKNFVESTNSLVFHFVSWLKISNFYCQNLMSLNLKYVQ